MEKAGAGFESCSAHSQRLRRVYNAVDENGDGVVTVGEIQALMEKLGMEMSWEEVESVVSPVSAKGDGALTFEEFGWLCRSIGAEAEAGDDDLWDAFRIFDKNDDGYISSTDLQHVLSALGFPQGRDLAHCQRMICTFDQDCNGVLDFSEFQSMMTSKFIAHRFCPERAPSSANGEGVVPLWMDGPRVLEGIAPTQR